MGQQKSFAFKLIASVGALSACALVATGYLGYALMAGHEEDRREIFTRAADAISDKISRNIFERYTDVQSFAKSESARSLDRNRIEQFMGEMMSSHAPIYDMMMVVDLDGRILAVNKISKTGQTLDPALPTESFKNEDWFTESVDGRIAEGQAHFTDLRVDPFTEKMAGTDGKVMIFSSPIRDPNTGKVLAVWTNRMSWKDVVEDVVLKEARKLIDDNSPIVNAMLLSSNGTFLVHPNPAKVLNHKQASFVEYKASGKKDFVHDIEDDEELKTTLVEAFAADVGYSTYPGKGWTTVVQTPLVDHRETIAKGVVGSAMAIVILFGVITIVVVLRVVKVLNHSIQILQASSEQVGETSSDVTQAAQGLSQSTSQQASALQQTAASIEEINAMIIRSTENANRSQQVAEQSSGIAKKGKTSVDEMSTAIHEINVSNEAIMRQISHSNSQMSDIARVINNIAEKTKIINEIVFQTKLLSFNASVEAARAGEHGKGFAVVAEEVGNLARMSGSAAKEISEMLAESTKSVEQIVQETRSKVEVLIADGRLKVQSGMEIADDCGKVLVEVVANVDDLNSMVAEIAAASREQSVGVAEITKAMNELEQTTQSNATTAHQTSGYASSLELESGRLGNVVQELVTLVKGGNATRETVEPQIAPAEASNVRSLHKLAA